MILSFPYGKDGKLEPNIYDKCLGGIIEPNEAKIGDETEVIRQALAILKQAAKKRPRLGKSDPFLWCSSIFSGRNGGIPVLHQVSVVDLWPVVLRKKSVPI